ncbi:MAG: DMT family transporter [Gammaproteobacteria bacterium]|nr:DMT family transporter [Gammaproteobacteria bacterium]CAJ2376750.1 MAG: conserved membrane hypothetical protein [Arenicellales bacterium IbO2]MDA7961773.1 DMT family transporter [Gammaproteobacteria bacterium]MDA7970187.1 DMT family transporter [Gammaproteobacteria bacterium]MDA7995399.1 DMT family transporter [Gammaproteobacteria bacterium]
MTILALLAALATAVCWAVAPFIGFPMTKSHGSFAFARVRTLFAAGMLLILLPLYAPIGEWGGAMPVAPLLLFAASGIVGIIAGDALYFAGMRRLGPRRNGMLFAAHAPFAFLYAAVFIGEIPSLLGVLGCAATIGGIVLAIRYAGDEKSFRDETNRFEVTEGSLPAAVAIGLGAAAFQALALVMVRHGMANFAGGGGDEPDPIFAAAIRIFAAALIVAPATAMPFAALRPRRRPNLEFTVRAAATGFIAMVLGISLLTFALAQDVQAGIISSLSATSPVMVVFIQWALTKKRPRAAAFAGAAAAVAGIAMLSAAAPL